MDKEKMGYGIRINNLNKSFDSLNVLEDVDVTIHPGEFVAIVGHSGCGKSTLLRIIAGLDKPTSGSVHVNEKEVNGINCHVRFLFQEARLLPWKNILDNVIIGAHGKNESSASITLEKVGLIDKKSAWPKVLSGGQKQRVSLARALAGNPNILLLDEPLGALDALTRIEMQDLIEGLWLEKGFTALLVTHDVSEAVRLADRVLIMDEKRIKMDVEITLPRPRLKDNDTNYFEQLILNQLLKKNVQKEEYETRKVEYTI